MAERFRAPRPEKRPITDDVFDLEEGPIDIALANHQLRIVDPGRDLAENWNADCLVIDPADYDPRSNKGFRPLWEGSGFTIGRNDQYVGNFDISNNGYISSRHVYIERKGNKIRITDLGSTNGTFRLIFPDEFNTHRTPSTYVEFVSPEFSQNSDRFAGFSVASDSHPERNDDAYFISKESAAFGVCDGVGGRPGSDKASKLAANVAAEYLAQIPQQIPRSLGHLAMHEALWTGHEAILNLKSDVEIATTATVAKVFKTENGTPYVVVGSVGDSRAYIIRDGQLQTLTLDQVKIPSGETKTAAQRRQETFDEVTDLSQLSEKDRELFRQRHLITSTLGREKYPPVITLADFALLPGDKALLTTDGIHDNLKGSEIQRIANQYNSADMIVKGLVRAAQTRSREFGHARAKRDDFTAVAMLF